MPSESLLKLRDELLTEVHFAIDPVRRLPVDPDWRTKLPYVEHRFASEMQEVLNKMHGFCQTAHIAGSGIATQTHNGLCELMKVCRHFNAVTPNLDVCAEAITTAFGTACFQLRSLPCQDISVIMPALSPFTTYLTLLALCRSTKGRIDVFDPFIDKKVFDRYLGDVDKSATITLVTEDARLTRDPNIRDGIVAISELLARERPSSYRLCTVTSIHDRYARIDDTVYHLGGSLKDAATNDPYTITTSTSDATIHKALDDMIADGTEWFGPKVTNHRKV
jgi:hypothetical protein